MDIQERRISTAFMAVSLATILAGCLPEMGETVSSEEVPDPPPTSAPNNSPIISGSPDTSVTMGEAYSFTPAASDPDGDSLTFSVQNKPSWAQFNSANGALTGIPLLSDVGTASNIAISVSDGDLSSSLPQFSITVVQPAPPPPANNAPVISGTPTTVALTGVAYSFTPTASDPDGDTLTFSIQNKPGWAVFSAVTGALSGMPLSGDVGTYPTIIVSASDGALSSSLEPFSVTVVQQAPPPPANNAPVISGTPASEVLVDNAYSFTPTASDPDGDALTFSMQNKPTWAQFDTTTGTLSGTPQVSNVGDYQNIAITVSDGDLSNDLPPFSVTVVQNSDGSITLSWTAPTQNEDGSALTDLAAYKFYYGTSPGNYSDQVRVDNPGITTYVIENLAPATYYVVATAVNDAGVESQYSNEAVKQVP